MDCVATNNWNFRTVTRQEHTNSTSSMLQKKQNKTYYLAETLDCYLICLFSFPEENYKIKSLTEVVILKHLFI